jgi:hypothetical protein
VLQIFLSRSPECKHRQKGKETHHATSLEFKRRELSSTSPLLLE